MTVKFIAEDVPAYQVETWLKKPWRDEDLGMSAPRTVLVAATEGEARRALAEELAHWASRYEADAEYSAYYRAKVRLFQAAADVLNAGSTAVKVHGRYYRVREVETP